jgi:hypothetical protein
MTPEEIRNATWETVKSGLRDRQESVYEAWLFYGPCTTRELAGRTGIDLLNIRPRTTELYALGLLICLGKSSGQGIYQARTRDAWRSWHESQYSPQLTLL